MSQQMNVPACEDAPAAMPDGLSASLAALVQLVRAAPPPGEFFAAFLEQLRAATGARGATFWKRGADDAFTAESEVNGAAMGLHGDPAVAAGHDAILRAAAQRDRALWVPPYSGPRAASAAGTDRPAPRAINLTSRGLLLAPVLVDREPAGVVEVWFDHTPDVATRRGHARLLAEAAGLFAAYLHDRQWQRLREQQRLWGKLEAFARHVHASLDPAVVAQWVANEGRPLAECDQLSVAVRWGTATRVLAVSGAPVLDRGSRLVQCLELLCTRVLAGNETVVYRGTPDEALPPAVAAALDAYLAESNCRGLVALPLTAPPAEAAGAPASAVAGPCGVLVAEVFTPAPAVEKLPERLATLAGHAAPALANAVRVARTPLQPVMRGLAQLRDGASRRRLTRTGLFALPVLLVAAALTMVPVPFRLAAGGQLLPAQRQVVYAPLHGKVVELRVRHGDRVERGQELLLLEDLETQLQLDQLAIRIGAAEQRLALLGERLGRAATGEEHGTLSRERINQDYELKKAVVERDILLQSSRSPRRAPVVAPLAGKVVTFDAQEQLQGKTVKPGDPLLRVAAVRGPWEIELHLPERSVGPVRAALRARGDGFLDVDVLLASQPHRTYRARLDEEGLGGETMVKDNAVVLPLRVRIADDELAAQLETLPVGLEVRARVRCGDRAAGAVWFFELWEFLYEHVIF